VWPARALCSPRARLG